MLLKFSMTERHLTKTAVFVFIENSSGELLMLRRANTGWADGMLTPPTGHVDQGDMPTDACVKEVKEEVGLDIDSADLKLMHTVYIRDVYVHFFFTVSRWSGESVIGEPHLSSELVWIDTSEFPDDVIPEVRRAFVLGQEGIAFSEQENQP